MKYLILVKHSNPDVIKLAPAREWGLSENGRIRAQKLAEKLKLYEPEVIVSSIEPKARQTAEIISENLGLNFVALNGLHEHDRSQSPFYEDDEFQRLVRDFFNNPDMLIFGNETADQALIRFRDSIDSVMRSYTEQTVIVVAHGTVISLFVSWLTGEDGYLLWNKLGLPSFLILDMKSKTCLKIENIP
ncbi:MAG: histidine phosphatase family protein [Anaerolineales bacterium]|nr:histidine phosphatase family protein [Anaerolineales bacterium]